MFPLRFPVRNELGLTYAATGMGNGVRERFPILDQRAVTESPIPGDYRIHSAPSTRFRRTSHARAGKLEGGKAFVLCVRGGVDCFQCLLRSGPAAATVAPQCRIGCRLPQDHRLQGLKPDEPLASISGRDVGVPSIVFTKIGNRSLTPFPVPSYRGYCQCETDQRNGDGICVKANMKWDAYDKCGGLTDPNKEIGKTICVPNNKRYGREIICTREINWANLATFLGTGIGTGATIGAALASPTGPGAAVTGLVGGAVGGVAVMIASFGCPVRTCTMTDGAERDVLAVGIFSGQDCYHKDPVQNPVR